jgi:hypothetical protein
MRDTIVLEMTKALARHVEWVAEMTRHQGFNFPREYDLGLAVQDKGRTGLLKMRLETTRREYEMPWPWEASMDAVEDFGFHISKAAAQLVLVYIRDHPELVDRDKAEAVNKLTHESVWETSVFEAADKASKKATYREKR